MFKGIIFLLANKNPIGMNCEISPRSHLNACMQILYLTAHCLAKPAGYVNICGSIWAGEGKIDSSSQDLKKSQSYVTKYSLNSNHCKAPKTITVKYYVHTQAAF